MPGLQLAPALIARLKTWNFSTALPDALKALGAERHWQLLLTPLGQLPQEPEPEVALPLLDRTGTAQTTEFGWDWGATAGASAVVTVDVLDEALREQLNIHPGDGRLALSVGADLALTAGLTGQQAISTWGQASAAFSAAAGARLHWYFSDATSTLLVDAVAASTRFWRLPNDYTGLMALAPSPDFWGLRLDLTGTLDAQLSAGARQGWSGWTYGLDGDRAEIGLSVGVDAHVKFARTADVSLHVRPEQRHDRWGLKVELEVLDARSDAFALTLAASLDLSALAASAERALRAAWPAVDPAALTALTQPGTALGQRLAQIAADQLGDEDVRALALIALGQADAGATQARWVSQLTQPLTAVLDGALTGLVDGTADADALLAVWLDRLLGQRPLADELKAPLRQAATDALAQATQQWQQRVAALETALTGKTGAALDAVLAPLGALGDKIGQELKRLNGAVPEAVTHALGAYGQARERLLAALSDAKKAKLSLTLATQIQRSQSRGIAVAGWFSGQGDQAAAQALYQSLCSGRIALLGELVDAAQAGHAFELDEGWLTSAAKAIETQSATLTLFGAALTDTRVSLVDMEFKADLWGRLIAAKALAQVDARTLNPWLARTAMLGVSAGLTLADGVRRVEVALDGAFTARGRQVDKGFVQALVDGYAARVGVRPPRDVGALLGEPATPEQRAAFWRGLTVAVPVRLGPADWLKFEAQPRAAVMAAFLRHGLAALDDVYAGMKGFTATSPGEALREKADEFFQGDSAVGRMVAYLDLYEARYVAPRAPGIEYATRLGFDGVKDSSGVTEINLRFCVFHRFAGVLRAAAALHGSAAAVRQALQDAPDGELPTATRARVERPLRDIREALEAVTVASQTLTGLGEALAWPFATFLLAMAELTGQLPPGFLMVAEPAGADAPRPLLVA